MPTALLLEDEPLIAIDLEYELRKAGFDVATMATCTEAIDWLEVCRPNVVIVDIVLRDGPCDAIVDRLVTDKIPFIVHSGDLPAMHTGTPFAHGAWVAKPAEGAELVRVALELVPGS